MPHIFTYWQHASIKRNTQSALVSHPQLLQNLFTLRNAYPCPFLIRDLERVGVWLHSRRHHLPGVRDLQERKVTLDKPEAKIYVNIKGIHERDEISYSSTDYVNKKRFKKRNSVTTYYKKTEYKKAGSGKKLGEMEQTDKHKNFN